LVLNQDKCGAIKSKSRDWLVLNQDKCGAIKSKSRDWLVLNQEWSNMSTCGLLLSPINGTSYTAQDPPPAVYLKLPMAINSTDLQDVKYDMWGKVSINTTHCTGSLVRAVSKILCFV
jgi:hypothetical protein